MSFGGGYQGGRTRMSTKVHLNVYDLSPANDVLYPLGVGLHHSGVEIIGNEYSFASGAGVFQSTPKEAPGARFREAIFLGAFEGGQAELNRALDEVKRDFGPEDYSLVRRNCNHFANALVWRLLGRTIPPHINRLADIGVCCSCLLPKQMLEHAPVGAPNSNNNHSNSAGSGGSRFGTGRSASVAPTTKAFSGAGAKLGSSSSSSTQSSTASGIASGLAGRFLSAGKSLTSPSGGSHRQEDLVDRREKARMAAIARMERQSLNSSSHD